MAKSLRRKIGKILFTFSHSTCPGLVESVEGIRLWISNGHNEPITITLARFLNNSARSLDSHPRVNRTFFRFGDLREQFNEKKFNTVWSLHPSPSADAIFSHLIENLASAHFSLRAASRLV
jgi:hypothetical protein